MAELRGAGEPGTGHSDAASGWSSTSVVCRLRGNVGSQRACECCTVWLVGLDQHCNHHAQSLDLGIQIVALCGHLSQLISDSQLGVSLSLVNRGSILSEHIEGQYWSITSTINHWLPPVQRQSGLQACQTCWSTPPCCSRQSQPPCAQGRPRTLSSAPHEAV